MAFVPTYRPVSGYARPTPTRIPEILMEMARAREEQAARSSAIWTPAINQLGQLGGQVVSAIQQERRAKLEAQKIGQFFQGLQQAQDPTAAVAAAVNLWGPEKGLTILKGYSSLLDMQRARQQADQNQELAADDKWRAAQAKRVHDAASAYLSLHGDEARSQVYGPLREMVLPEVMSLYNLKPEDADQFLPEQFSPEADQKLEGIFSRGPLAPEPMKVAKDTALVDAAGNVTIPSKSQERPDTRSLEARIAAAAENGDQEEVQRLLEVARRLKEAENVNPGGGKTPTYREFGGQLYQVTPSGLIPATEAGGAAIPKAPASTGKLSATAVDRVAGIEQGLGIMEDLESLLVNPETGKSDGESWLGPAAGRIVEMGIATPGVPVSDRLARFAAQTATLKNAVVKAITGAQMSEPEAKRIMKQIPDFTDKPVVWHQKLEATRDNMELLRQRTLELSRGVTEGEAQAAGGGAESPPPGTRRTVRGQDYTWDGDGWVPD